MSVRHDFRPAHLVGQNKLIPPTSRNTQLTALLMASRLKELIVGLSLKYACRCRG
jgi:hypothetical protein